MLPCFFEGALPQKSMGAMGTTGLANPPWSGCSWPPSRLTPASSVSPGFPPEEAPGDPSWSAPSRRSRNGQDSSPEVPPELKRVGLGFLHTGVQQRLFEMACDLLETRKRALRCGEELLGEMCRMVLGTACSSTCESAVPDNPRCLPASLRSD